MKPLTVCVGLMMFLPHLAFGQVPMDYSDIYEQASPAVVTIHTDSGTGSGFLVTSFGHIATNYHVVRNAKYLAVQFNDGRKVGAQVVATYETGDMAVIKVNSSVVESIHPLELAAEENDASIKVGIPVVAIGSPEIQEFVMTKGIVSKTSDTALFGDFVLQPGNSGGPLMNAAGEVIGMNTFIDGTIAGSIRIDPLRELLSSDLLQETVAIEPSADLLPAIRPDRYPIDVLNMKVSHEQMNLEAYRFQAGDFQVTTITPVLIAKVQMLQDRMRAANQFIRRTRNLDNSNNIETAFYSWNESAGNTLAFAVRFEIQPLSGQTAKSKWLKSAPHLATFGKASKLDMEFKGEFKEFRLYRDGELIQPITPGRYLVSGSSGPNRFIDQAFAGMYVYDPIEFLSGNTFKIEIVDSRHPESVHKQLVFKADSPLIRQIRSDFSYHPPSVMVVGTH